MEALVMSRLGASDLPFASDSITVALSDMQPTGALQMRLRALVSVCVFLGRIRSMQVGNLTRYNRLGARISGRAHLPRKSWARNVSTHV